MSIDKKRIEAVGAVIAPYVRVTPTLALSGADFGLPPFPLTLKLELLQHSGSFKARGAFANLLLRSLPAVGVAAASGGNHGAAVAYAAMRLGVRAKIFVPTVSSPAKVQQIRAYGADVTVVGERYADALAASENWSPRRARSRFTRSISRKRCSARARSAWSSPDRRPRSTRCWCLSAAAG